MKIKTHNVESENAQGIATEIMFEVASARASKTELLQLLIKDKDGRLTAKLRSAAIRVLKEMKSRGAVQVSRDIIRFFRAYRCRMHLRQNIVYIIFKVAMAHIATFCITIKPGTQDNGQHRQRC